MKVQRSNEDSEYGCDDSERQNMVAKSRKNLMFYMFRTVC
jgi:hypothetical protein